MDSDDAEAALDQRVAAARPDGDPVTRAVWRARVAETLFGETAAVTVGRYRLRRQLGRGGGGTVYVASDPELDREVAVKLIRSTSERQRDRALAEGRALARLSHPNIVPVHDVGATADHVFIVMELLHGASLRAYAAELCTARDLVVAYRQAASGLAAAHAAGLVHRDFKPDNALFGDDGRLRVVDFGLAAAGDPATVGTAGYMAPEQRIAGAACGPAVDQYALGISLGQAFSAHGRTPPTWIARIIARTTAEAPGDRFGSMAAVERALASDPRARRRRVAMAAAPIAAAVVIVGLGVGRGDAADSICDGGAEALARVWTPARGEAASSRVAGLGTPFAVAAAPVIQAHLQSLGKGWVTAYRRGCTAHEHGELSSQLYERATECLARSRLGIDAVLDVLERGTADQLASSMTALAAVEPPGRCADVLALAELANPQPTVGARVTERQIDLARFHARAATPEAVRLAEVAVEQARRQRDDALTARALLVLGHALIAENGEMSRAIQPLHEAILLALAAGADEVMAEAFARHAFVVISTHPGGRAAALDGIELARVVGRRAGPRGSFARALLENNAGVVAWMTGDFDQARQAFSAVAHEIATVSGPDGIELTRAAANLAVLSRDPLARRRVYDDALERVRDAVGPDHPQALLFELLRTADDADPRAAAAGLAGLCERAGRLHPHLVTFNRSCWFESTWQSFANGGSPADPETAPPAADETLPLERQLTLAYVAIAHGTPPQALLERVVAEQRAALSTARWYKQIDVADAELALAAAARRAGDLERARAAATRALAALDAYTTGGVAANLGTVVRRRVFAEQLRATVGSP